MNPELVFAIRFLVINFFVTFRTDVGLVPPQLQVTCKCSYNKLFVKNLLFFINVESFIQRWGTHYIKSSKFGGQLQIRKFMDATDVSSKKEFAQEMEMEFKSLFASVGARESSKSGESSRNQRKTTSTTVVALGGSHEVASILSDAYSPSFKTAFKDWLASIPQYPKPFHFQVAPITNLLNFKMRDLFPGEKVHWGCEGHAANLRTETNDNGEKVTFFQIIGENGTAIKYYCLFESRKGLEEAIKRRRISLKRAIEVFMEEVCLSE